MATIAEEIQRLNKAKEDIRNSIENKGVSVPSDTSISDYSTYIDNIPSGGGGGQTLKYVDNVEFNDYGRLIKMRFTGSEVPAYAYSYSMLEEVDISDNTTIIGERAFQECSGLTSVTMSDSVKTIRNYGFYRCTGLESIDIPDSVEVVERSAFDRCYGLKSVHIGSGITSIEQYTFSDCNGLTSVTVLAITPPTLGTSVFNNTNNCPIYVPAGSVDAYKAAEEWKEYADRIKPLSEKP